MKIVDLFCGCGGFGLGAEMAGFKSVLAVDVDETLQSAYRVNFPNTKAIIGDLSKLNEADWRELLRDTKINGVIGGPPCQAFSRIGKNEKCDPRRSLLHDFYRHINLIQPDFFIMENVEGLFDKRNRDELDSAINTLNPRYTVVSPFVINAADVGAPTNRKRVIVVGYDSDLFSTMEPEDFLVKLPKVTVKDAISDLPGPVKEKKGCLGWASYPEWSDLSIYAQKMRALPKLNLGSETGVKRLKNFEVSGLSETKHSEAVKERYRSTPPGKMDRISKSKKLIWNGFCPTLRAGTGADKGSFQAVRPLHPEAPRVITVREAARLQGFPDWYTFHSTKWHSFRMIGNSVSPIVSEHLLNVVKSKRLS
ncbi:MAG: DNA cytosine methyltransferase [Campylobacterales bacterium]|nr:DNA cytosine methyltransferase [Campylobacterales bacterium]